jgi:2-iminobutanoate/2-iminopropanoate deaminase
MRAGNLLFVSGQIAVAPDGSSHADADLALQTRLCLANLRAVLEAGGATLQQVAKVTVYLAEPEGWALFNSIYAEFFGTHKPARAMVPVAAFPGGFKIEIDAVAVLAG